MTIESLHERFNAMYDRVEMLTAMMAERTSDGVDLSMLQGMLQEAEKEKKSALAALRLARHQTSVAYPTSMLEQALVPHADNSIAS
jgi:hypothetical protein